ncbi:hypothetical protein CR513_01314, partial [Mucuna pruriens]
MRKILELLTRGVVGNISRVAQGTPDHHPRFTPRTHLVILVGAALSWCVDLEKRHIRTWKNLVEAFLKQYEYNEDMAPNHSRLQNMVKKDVESFKEYA